MSGQGMSGDHAMSTAAKKSLGEKTIRGRHPPPANPGHAVFG
jgi:hypothetical protein